MSKRVRELEARVKKLEHEVLTNRTFIAELVARLQEIQGIEKFDIDEFKKLAEEEMLYHLGSIIPQVFSDNHIATLLRLHAYSPLENQAYPRMRSIRILPYFSPVKYYQRQRQHKHRIILHSTVV